MEAKKDSDSDSEKQYGLQAMDTDDSDEQLDWNECIELMYDFTAEIAHPRCRKFHKIEKFYEMLQRMDAFLKELKDE